MRRYGRILQNRLATVMCALMILLLAAGVTAGSIYIAKGGEETAQEIKSYMDGFFASFAESRNNMAVFRNSLASNLISAAIIFCMGFFRLGCIGTGALLVKKGFAAGFTAAAFFKFYGADGMLIMLSTMPTVIITIPALLILSAGSVSFSLRNDKKEKKLIFSYIFFFILMLSIFCAASLTEGFLTTTFINWSIPKVN